VATLAETELRQEILKLQRRIEKLAALLRLALALLQTSGFTLSGERLPEGENKLRLRRAVDQGCACVPLRAVLRFLHLSPRRFHAWRRKQTACALDDQSSWPGPSPRRLTSSEIQVIGALVTSPDYRYVATGTLAILAQVQHGSRLAVNVVPPRSAVRMATPAPPRSSDEAEVGLRTTKPDEMWHIETTVIRLFGGTRAYLHAVIRNFSRRFLPGVWPRCARPSTAWPCCSTPSEAQSVPRLVQSYWRTRAWRT
jgi:putative transposase